MPRLKQRRSDHWKAICAQPPDGRRKASIARRFEISSGSLAMLAAIRRALSCDIKPDWLPMLTVLRK